MSKYVPDIISKRWVIISPQRLSRPEGYTDKKDELQGCPFCEGNEKETPPEVFRYGGGEMNKRGWKVRVVPNKYPITDIHEVIVHSPDHQRDIHELPLTQVELIFTAYRDRFNFYRKKGQVLLFCNHGEHAGGSLPHPHSQLVVIPGQINLDTLTREPINNVVQETPAFHVYCPDFSQWPYEVWITPKRRETVFGDITDEDLKSLAQIVQKMLQRVSDIYKIQHVSNLVFGFNYYIYPKEDWYFRIIPRFVHRAGLELGTGLYVNVIDPIESALELKGVEKKMIGVMKKLKKY